MVNPLQRAKEKCHLDHEYIDLKEQKVILDQEKCHLDHERLQCKGQHCPSTTVFDFICGCKISCLCSPDFRSASVQHPSNDASKPSASHIVKFLHTDYKSSF